ncbi:unnamed protein product [Caenorhabditis nigoni]
MIVIKIFAWKLKNSGKGKDIFGVYDKSSGKIDGYDKWQLLLGYYLITFLSIIAQVVIWWIDYDLDLGFFVAFIYHSLILAICVIFLLGPSFQYDFEYTLTQFNIGLGIAIIPTLATLPFNGFPLCLRHFYFNFFLAFFYSEIQCVKNNQIKIFDLNTKDLETMENSPNRFAVAFLLLFSDQTLSEIVEQLQ